MTVHTSSRIVAPLRALQVGALAGVGGGIVFGLLMAVMGMLPMVGMLIGQPNAIAGFAVHLAISAVIGAIYGWFIAHYPTTTATALVGGIVNGVAWWVLGALVLMPLLLGMTEMVFRLSGPQWISLAGHLIYGVVTALLYNSLIQR